MITEEPKKDYYEYLNMYFSYKNKYDTQKGQKKCIKCKKNGGTIFSNKNNRYVAVCGAEKPCSLHLELYRGFFSNNLDTLYQYVQILEASKETIIMLQNNEIFHFSTDKEVKEKYEDEKKHYETVTNLFLDLEKCIYKNDEIKEKIKSTTEKINQTIVDIRSSMMDYQKKQSGDDIQLAIHQQINGLLPALEELRKLKYEVVQVLIEKVKKTTKYKREGEDLVESRDVVQSILFQKEVCFEKDEVNLKEDPAVIKWSGI